MKSQYKSDERMLEQEKKRLRMEERQLEREDQQHREDREFQLQMRLLIGSNIRRSFGAPNKQHLGQPFPIDHPSPSPYGVYGTTAYPGSFDNEY